MTSFAARWHLLVVFAVIGPGGPAWGESVTQRQHLIHLLEQETKTNSGWQRIHAADALLDHGQSDVALSVASPEVETAAPPYRIGVWRVMARAAGTDEERRSYRARIRKTMLDANAPDRVHAAESLAKLGFADAEDRAVIAQWAGIVDPATSAYPLWLLALSSPPAERERSEARLAALLASTNGVARGRAAFALGRLAGISASTLDALNKRLATEPRDSSARCYLLAAILQHVPKETSRAGELRTQLAGFLANGRPDQQLEAGIILGRRGTAREAPLLAANLTSREPDARIGAANGLLSLQP